MEINERWVKIGKVPVSHNLNLGSGFQIKFPEMEEYLQFTCVKIEHKDNQDGSEDITYVLKFNG